MQINLWYNDVINEWKWTLVDSDTLDMESGQRKDLKEAMSDVANTVECLIKKKD